jgi:hypothetical protein
MPNNRGRTHAYLFFLKPSYWCGYRRSRVEEIPTSKGRKRRMSSIDQNDTYSKTSVKEEKYQLLEDERENEPCDGLRIIGLTKVKLTPK